MGDAPSGERASLLGAVGQLWACGAKLDLNAVAARSAPVQMPGYPFARNRHWIEPAAAQPQAAHDVQALLQAQMAVLRGQVALLAQRDAARAAASPATRTAAAE
jgi:acyl transferase domain-containing protein